MKQDIGYLSPETIQEALKKLGDLAFQQEHIIDIAIYKKNSLIITYNLKKSTKNVDTVFEKDKKFLNEAILKIAYEMTLPQDWLNHTIKNYTKVYINCNEIGSILPFASYPSEQQVGLRVFATTPEYFFAMKYINIGLGENSNDVMDVKKLIQLCEIKKINEVIEIIESYYPKSTIIKKSQFAFEEIFSNLNTIDTNILHYESNEVKDKANIVQKKSQININNRPKSLFEVSQLINEYNMSFSNAISEFIDEIKKMSTQELEKSLKEEPEQLNNKNNNYKFWHDSYIGAVAEHLARLNNTTIPQWTENQDRFLHKKAFFDNSGLTSLNATLIIESPLSFRRRGIFTESKPLRRC